MTLARQKSAMIPIITDTVCIERVSIYNARVLSSNPLNGVWFKNTTGKHLLQGPLTVLEKDAYAGDAQIDNVPPDQSRLVSYGIDLDVTMDQKGGQTQSVVGARIAKGTLILNRKLVQTVSYFADNKSSQSKELVIEHPVQPEWKLVDTPKPFETTPSVYRFRGAAPANKVTTLVVKQEWVRNETVELPGGDLSELLMYSRSGEMPKAVRDALTKAIRLRESIADLDRQIAARVQQIGEITAEQNRIRENMRVLPQSGQYYDRLLAKLNEQESTIEKLQTERKELTARRDAGRKELDDYLDTLNTD